MELTLDYSNVFGIWDSVFGIYNYDLVFGMI